MKRAAAIFFAVVMHYMAFGQSFPISNNTVNACQANFTDSDAGATPGFYAHNENYTFTICVPSADSIVLIFSQFSSEPGLDIIRFFDGQDTLSTQIGPPVSGNTLPGTIIATSGYLTVHWISDPSVASDGWLANWYAIVNQPDPPLFDPIPNPTCSTTTLNLTLNQSVNCDSLNPGSISIWGAQNQNIVSVNGVNCVGGATDEIQVTFALGLNSNGNYNVQLTTWFLDDCDSLWELTTASTFTVDDCPLEVELVVTDSTICEGDCIDIEAIVSGGVPGTYNYTWSPPLPNSPGPHNVCPNTNTTYSVTVTDAGPSSPGTDNIDVTVTPAPVLMPNFTVCQSAQPTTLTANPAGGFWIGPGIADGVLGTFNPDWAPSGVNTIWYEFNGCFQSMEITVDPMNAGPVVGACPTGAAFNLLGSPVGGTWSGNGITNAPAGTFDPGVAGIGSHMVIYSNPGTGCPDDTTFVNVDSVVIPANDTVCENLEAFYFNFSPLGGAWSGAGITNSFWGRFSPSQAGLGTHVLTYTVNGCTENVVITVEEVWAGWNFSTCPVEDTITIDNGYHPPGGIWSGSPGIVDSVNGNFWPGWTNGANGSSALYYTINGCTDTAWNYNRHTEIQVGDTLPDHCVTDTIIRLNWENTRRTPWGGNWYGTGVTDTSVNGNFDPAVSGPGTFMLTYRNNTCEDSIQITVHPLPTIADTTVCVAQSPFNLTAIPPGGTWNGPGILDPSTGLFSAAFAGVGMHEIEYRSPQGCVDTMTITVDALPVINMTNLDVSYCHTDTNIQISATPAGGVFTGDILPGNFFNPAQLGPGFHSITYIIGSGDCAVSQTIGAFVDSPLVIHTNLTDTTLCEGVRIRLTASATGGPGVNYNFSWSDGLGNGTSHLVDPGNGNSYTVRVTDNCSDPDSATFNISVVPPFDLAFDTSEIQCHGLPGWAEVIPSIGGSFSYQWDVSPPVNTATIQADAGTLYQVTVTNNSTGCSSSGSVRVPAYEELIAAFSPSPDENCASLLNPVFQFIDQSVGGVTGTWTFGDNAFESYSAFQNPTHTYADTGTYDVRLQIQNEGGCKDIATATVCVDPYSIVWIPNSFTPNDDGLNDKFAVTGTGLTEYSMTVFNRWGQIVFESNDPLIGWDGDYKFEPAPVGGYPYVVRYNHISSGKLFEKRGTVLLLR